MRYDVLRSLFELNTARVARVAMQAFAACCLVQSLSASSVYGVAASGQVSYSVQTASGNPTTISNSYTTGAVLPQTSYSQASNYGGQTSANGNSASAYVSTQTSSYGQLHEGISASSSNPASGGGATASAFLEWEDSITFAGAPAGTSVTVQVTNAYDGFFTSTGVLAAGSGVTESANLFNNLSSVDLVNNYTTNQPSLNVTQTGMLTTTVGSTLTLQEQLLEYLSGTSSFSGTIDFSNTSAVYLTVLTPGVTLVSAGGANYAVPAAPTPTSTPEPASVMLIAGGFIAVGTLFRQRKR